MGNNCVSNLFRLYPILKIQNGSSIEQEHYVQHYCSTSEFLHHWIVLILCCCALAFIIGVIYSCYRFDGGEMEFQYKPYREKDEEEQNDIV
jgi:hypothetical protein